MAVGYAAQVRVPPTESTWKWRQVMQMGSNAAGTRGLTPWKWIASSTDEARRSTDASIAASPDRSCDFSVLTTCSICGHVTQATVESMDRGRAVRSSLLR